MRAQLVVVLVCLPMCMSSAQVIETPIQPPPGAILGGGLEGLSATALDSAIAAGEAQVFMIDSPAGPLSILVEAVGPSQLLPAPPAPEAGDFRPPSLFSAPLPTGSGARSLGFSGSFVAIADDATAASWNPAGLINLERPEVSAVYRFTSIDNSHRSTNGDFSVGENSYSSDGLNYLSAAYPLYLEAVERNFTLSFNYQEAYDFTQEFSARTKDRAESSLSRTATDTFRETKYNFFQFQDDSINSLVTSEIETRVTSTLRQRTTTELESDLFFEQTGVIDALTPAFAVEVTPKISLGGALNLYQDSALGEKRIRSKTSADYFARTETITDIDTDRITTGSFAVDSTVTVPPLPPFLPEFTLALPGIEGEIPAFASSSSEQKREVQVIEGRFEQIDEFNDLEGVNGTIGMLATVSRYLSLGASVDLPWTADAKQTRTIRSSTTIYNEAKTRVLGSSESSVAETRDVEFEFPLFWTAGAVIRWTPSLYTSLDVGQTLWSDFAFTVEGEGKRNPFDGTPHGQNPIDDTWFVRGGTEFLWSVDSLFGLKKVEIPLRAGGVWEQRPAIGDPDDYYGFSVGTGFGFGEEPRRVIFDIAYSYLTADDVQSVIPEESGLTTDTDQHQVFVSGIVHF